MNVNHPGNFAHTIYATKYDDQLIQSLLPSYSPASNHLHRSLPRPDPAPLGLGVGAVNKDGGEGRKVNEMGEDCNAVITCTGKLQ